jgi:hypothetical protein
MKILPQDQDLSNTNAEWLRRSVYDGAERLGHIVKYKTEVTAFDRLGRPIGVFDTILEAVAAIRRGAP